MTTESGRRPAPRTLDGLLSAGPDRADVVVSGGVRLSTAELDTRIATMAAGLNARGIGHGDRVAFQLPVGIDAVVVYRACWRIGVVAVPLHPLAGAAQLSAAVDEAEPSLLVAAPGMALAEQRSAIAPDAITGGASPSTPVDPADDALVMFTSGSTGVPKGVVHTHASLTYKTAQIIEAHGLTTDDCVLMPAPLAHVSGLLHGVLVPGAAGAKTVLMARWDPGEALDLIETEGVTWMVGPPTFFIGLMEHPAFASARVASLRLVSCGGAGVTPAFAERARRDLGAVVKRAYGSTEAPTVTTSHHRDPPERMIATDGRAFGETRLRVDDHGELWIRGPEVARGYLDPSATAESFVDGWFRTGDLATIDDGWLTITGRLGDRIIRGGENIAASEVEQHLEAHPSVVHAAVVAEPDDRLGERVVAFVVAPDGFDLDTCRAWFRERGATVFTTPERIEVVDELPVLGSGKVDRAGLAARLARDAGPMASSRAETMPAAIYRRQGELEVVTMEVPVPRPGEALVEVDHCGICGTDLHLVLDGWGTPDSVFGHEWSGRVVDPGTSGLAPGTPVVGLPEIECGLCRHCQAGRPSLCTDRRDAGSGPERGAYARFVALAADRLVAVPDGIDLRAAAFTEPLAVALHAVTNSGIRAGHTALVFGAGPIGAAVIAILVGRGVDVAAVEPSPVRRDLARRLGATVGSPDDLVIPPHPGHIAPDAVDVVFETSGARKAAEVGLTQLVGGGTLVIVGTGMDHPRLDTNRVLLNELHITGAFNYDAGGFTDALELIGSGTLPLGDLLESEDVGLDGLLHAMTRLRAGELAGKVLVRP